MTAKKGKQSKRQACLVLAKPNPDREIEFELNYLSSLSPEERFSLMLAKSGELKTNLIRNGHRKASSIIKRK
jgi:hypothetical protein